MDRALCFFSFDFDLTVTKNHTWEDLKLTDEKPGTVARAAQADFIQFADAQLLANLIDFVCKKRMIFCFCTMQYRGILEAGLRTHPILAPVFATYVGKQLFIIDRTEVHRMHGGNKAKALSGILNRRKSTYSGIHLDDTMRHEADFEAMNIELVKMTPGTGFSRTLGSSLDSAIDIIENKFSNWGRPQNVPEGESVYANTSPYGASQVPPGFNFHFLPLPSGTHKITDFCKELRSVLRPNASPSRLSRQGAVRVKR